MTSSKQFSNPFEADNARNSTPEDLPNQFVFTKNFKRLIAQKNHVVLGARGSGKTAIVKMLSHEFLANFNHPVARDVIKSKKFIGVYVPMRLSWSGGLKNKPWMNEEEEERHFEWRLNIKACSEFLNTLDSVLKTYTKPGQERVKTERTICQKIASSWFDSGDFYSVYELAEHLSDIEYKKLINDQVRRVRSRDVDETVGIQFELSLFEPLKRAISIVKRYMSFPSDGVWCICLDEAEYLDELHHRILNSHLRTYADGLVFKITTTPYHHYTLDTNTNAPLTLKDDFDYVYLDAIGVEKKSNSELNALKDFAAEIFQKRIRNTGWAKSGVDLDSLLGSSWLLSNQGEHDQETIFRLIEKYANNTTKRRAKELLGTKEFDDQIGRKMKGALFLRDKLASTKGHSNTDLYSGADMVVKCADGNPRKLISIFNMLYNSSDEKVGFRPIPKHVQDRLLRQLSNQEYLKIASEPRVGERLYKVIETIGFYFKDSLHFNEIGTDILLSFKYDISEDFVWPIIAEAVAMGLIRPIVEAKNPDDLPLKQGTFRLSYALCPYFYLLPRRGKSKSLKAILRKNTNGVMASSDLKEQLDLI